MRNFIELILAAILGVILIISLPFLLMTETIPVVQ